MRESSNHFVVGPGVLFWSEAGPAGSFIKLITYDVVLGLFHVAHAFNYE